MSFILKGIDLPKGYKALHMRVQSDGVVRYVIEGDDPVHIIDRACAIQIPKEHGRIIDEREAIRGWCKGCAFNDGICGKDETICEDKEMCKYAPTLLEREEKECINHQ